MLRTPSRRTTRRHPLECDACEGLGQTEACRTEIATISVFDAHGVAYDVVRTVKQGSGCLKCGGTGRLDPARYIVTDVVVLRCGEVASPGLAMRIVG